MQKIDFIKNLEIIVEKLKSNEIVMEFNVSFEKPVNEHNYQKLNPVLFQSKSNYDQIKNVVDYSEILNNLGAEEIYNEQNLANLTQLFTPKQPRELLAHPKPLKLFNFHNTLVSTLILAKNVLQNKIFNGQDVNNIDRGIVIFQILIEGEGLEAEKYIKILNALQELIETISKIFNETDQKPEVILLDSGSDTNLGIKSGVETAKSLFLIFKEIWDFITNFRYYKQKLRNNSLLESLQIRAEITKKIEDGILTQEEGLQYIHIIKTRTDDLIGMKVLPKDIVLDSNIIENKKLLSDFEGYKMLGPAESSD